MNRYTIQGKWADDFVDSQLNLLRNSFPAFSQSIVSCLLFGGYGRGEGLVLNHPVLSLMNDIDIFFVINDGADPGNITHLKDITQHNAQIIGVDIDMFFIPLSHISNLPFTTLNYHFRYGSKILFGQKDILELFPKYDPSQLPITMGEDLLLNKISQIFQDLSPELFQGKGITFKHYYRLSKAILAATDAILVLNRLYTVRDADKNSMVKKHNLLSAQETFLLDWAIDVKLAGSIADKTNYIDIYNKTLVFYQKTFRKHLSIKYYNAPVFLIYLFQRYGLKQLYRYIRMHLNKEYRKSFYKNHYRFREMAFLFGISPGPTIKNLWNILLSENNFWTLQKDIETKHAMWH